MASSERCCIFPRPPCPASATGFPQCKHPRLYLLRESVLEQNTYSSLPPSRSHLKGFSPVFLRSREHRPLSVLCLHTHTLRRSSIRRCCSAPRSASRFPRRLDIRNSKRPD